jgi:hypothetical protein
MPVHRAPVKDHESPADALERAVQELPGNEAVSAMQLVGTEWVLVTVRKAGRPPKETR